MKELRFLRYRGIRDEYYWAFRTREKYFVPYFRSVESNFSLQVLSLQKGRFRHSYIEIEIE